MPNKDYTYFAELAPDGTVLRVIVASPAFIAKQPGTWVQTWMPDGQARSRKNYAGVGYVFDADRNAFVAPKPTPDATFNETTCRWDVVPVAMPERKEPR